MNQGLQKIVDRIKELLELRFGAQAGTCCVDTIKKREFDVRIYKGVPRERLTEIQAFELIEALEKLWIPRVR